MAITPDDVRQVASLAKLELDDHEVRTFAAQLGAILEHFAKVAAVDLDGVEATRHAVPLDCPMRADQPAPPLPRADALRNAPQQEEGLFAVPKVIG